MNFDNFKIPKIALGEIKPYIPNINTLIPNNYQLPRIASAIEQFETNTLIREIDSLYYDLELKMIYKKAFENRRKAIIMNMDIKLGLLVSVVVTIISVIIPFMFIMHIEIFENVNGMNFLILYMTWTFFISMIFMFGYLIFSNFVSKR